MIDQMINLIILTVSSLMISGGDCKLDLSVDIGGNLKTGNFEVDCTIIDKAKKLSKHLKMSSQSLEDDQLELIIKRMQTNSDKKNYKQKGVQGHQ